MLSKWPLVVLIAIVIFACTSRLFNLGNPKTYYFDEVYHAMTAKLVSYNDPRAFEWTHGDTIEPDTYVEWLHPPLAKYAQASMMIIAGRTAFGWRLSSVLFGTGVVLLTALLAQRLFARPWLSVLAAGFAALDGLLLTQSRIAMNDIHVVFGYLLTLYIYIWYRQKGAYWRLVLVGVAIGLTLATKWSGAFLWITIVLFEAGAVCYSLYQLWLTKQLTAMATALALIKQSLIRILVLLLLPLLLYIASYLQMFLQGKNLSYLYELHQQIFWYQFNLDATHPYQSRPLDWLFDSRPVWYFVEYLPNNQRADIYNTGNPFVYYGGLLAVVVTGFTLAVAASKFPFQTLVNRKTTNKPQFKVNSLALPNMKAPPNEYFSLFFIFCAYFLCWVAWLFSPRIMFSYHYAPAVPLLCILLAYWTSTLWNWTRSLQSKALRTLIQISISALLLLSVVFYIVWYPHWVGIPVSTSFADTVYFAIPSWR